MDFTFVQLYLSRNSKYWRSQELSDFHIKFRMNKFDEFQNRFNSPTSARTFQLQRKFQTSVETFQLCSVLKWKLSNFRLSNIKLWNISFFPTAFIQLPVSHFWATNKPFEIIICFREVHWDDHSTLINQNNLVLSTERVSSCLQQSISYRFILTHFSNQSCSQFLLF